MSAPGAGTRNLPLDGIRGIAIALIIVFHAFQGVQADSRIGAALVHLTGSLWIGVDLFFVLSGYLITGILLRSRDRDGYFRIFYMRRFFRIFPLYYAFLGALFLIAIVHREWMAKLDLSWNLLYLSNVRLAILGWPWRPIGHLWSLSIEEQFYLVWPAVIFLMSRRHTLKIIVALFCLFVALRPGVDLVLEKYWNQDYGVYGMLHFDGLLLGAALAALHLSLRAIPRARRIAWAALLIAGAILTVQGIHDRGLNGYHWKGVEYLNYSLIAICGAAVIAISIYSDARAPINRALLFHPLIQLGKYSYAMYILHYPLDTAFRSLHLHPSGAFTTIPYAIFLTCASFACALVTWKVLEEPCIRLKDRWFSYVPARRSAAAAQASTTSATSAAVK